MERKGEGRRKAGKGKPSAYMIRKAGMNCRLCSLLSKGG